MLNIKDYHDLLWFKVKINYQENNVLKMSNPLLENFRFSVWRNDKNASSCECQLILDKEEFLLPNQEKDLIIVITKTVLSESFQINETLFWGATQALLGTLEIIEEYKISNFELLFRPLNLAELTLIKDSGFLKFPPRLPEQPIFYPVLNEEYASKIAKEWNEKAYGAGYVVRFYIKKDYISKYSIQNVGGKDIDEYWIPAEELEKFNQNIIGKIEVIREFLSDFS